jgi:hypothetical protein
MLLLILNLEEKYTEKPQVKEISKSPLEKTVIPSSLTKTSELTSQISFKMD